MAATHSGDPIAGPLGATDVARRPKSAWLRDAGLLTALRVLNEVPRGTLPANKLPLFAPPTSEVPPTIDIRASRIARLLVATAASAGLLG